MALLEAGACIGDDFLIERPLSEGGMGAVYVARQKSTGVLRALKTMHSELLGDERLRDRFVAEAKLAATIPSEHVVKVLGAGWDASRGMPWLAMELLSGQPLSSLIESVGPLSCALTERILEQACHGLGAAASIGVIHRDVKPDNMIVSPSTTVGLPFVLKIVDFGIAKQSIGSAGKSTQVVGTPLWLAPEQTETRGNISPATDVWPLGLLAFACLTNGGYWNAAYDEGGTLQTFLRELLIDDLKPASARAAELGITLPSWFDGWFSTCVARDPAARFVDARAAYEAFAAAHRAGGQTPVIPEEMGRFVAALSKPATLAPIDSGMDRTVPATPGGHGGTVPAAPSPRAFATPHAERTEIPRSSPATTAAPSRGSRLPAAAKFAALLVIGAPFAYRAFRPEGVVLPDHISVATSVSYSVEPPPQVAPPPANSRPDPSATAPLGDLAPAPSPKPQATQSAKGADFLDTLLVDTVPGAYTCTFGGQSKPCQLVPNGKSYRLMMVPMGQYFTGTATSAGETLLSFSGIYNDKEDPHKTMQAAGSLLKQGRGWYMRGTDLVPTLTLSR